MDGNLLLILGTEDAGCILKIGIYFSVKINLHNSFVHLLNTLPDSILYPFIRFNYSRNQCGIFFEIINEIKFTWRNCATEFILFSRRGTGGNFDPSSLVNRKDNMWSSKIQLTSTCIRKTSHFRSS